MGPATAKGDAAIKVFAWYLPLIVAMAAATDPLKPQNCCNDLNYLANRTHCVNGAKINLNCAYLVLNFEYQYNDSPQYDAEGNWVDSDGDVLYKREFYCLANTSADMKTFNFLVCMEDDDEVLEDGAYTFFSEVFALISVVSLVATLAVYVMLPFLRDLQGKCLMCCMSSLAVTYLTFTLIGHDLILWVFLPLVYFLTLSSFFWLNIVSFNLWRSARMPSHSDTSQGKLFFIYNIYGWGMPLVLSGTQILYYLFHRGSIVVSLVVLLLTFIGPIVLILIANVVLFVWTAVRLWKVPGNNTGRRFKAYRTRLFLYCKLFVVMGLSWVFEPLNLFWGRRRWVIMQYVNALQGVLIFCTLVVFRKRVRKGLAKKVCCGITFPASWETQEDDEDSCDEIDTTERAPANNAATTPQEAIDK